MMMYKCDECGHEFSNDEAGTYRQYAGECHGTPAYETFQCCPECGGDYAELEQCSICGELFELGETTHEICKECKGKLWARFAGLIKQKFSEDEIETIFDCIEQGYFIA